MKIKGYIPFYKRNLHLAFPVVLSQVGQVTVSLADNIMVGHVGTTELAASSFANSIFLVGMLFGLGITIGITPLVGNAFGNNNLKKVVIYLKNGLFIHFLAAVCLTSLMFLVYFLLPLMGQTSEVIKLAKPYYLLLCASYLPLIIFFAIRQFFEGIGNTRIAMIITLAANVVNVVVNYIFIYGKFGFPALGLNGAGVGTLIARIFMPLLFAVFVIKNVRFKRYFFVASVQKISQAKIISILKIGIPIGFQIVIEMLAFSVGAIMMGWLGETPLAAHQVAIGLASLTYMISLGISQANTIRVSHQMGKRDFNSLKMAAYASTQMVLVFMSIMGIVFILSRRLLPYLFTPDPEVIQIAAGLLIIAAIFQIFDGLQVVMLSSLRGMADVRIPMFISFFSYLILGVPASYVFAFLLGFGPSGIWCGYLLGLGTAGILFYFRFRCNLKKMHKKTGYHLFDNPTVHNLV